MNALQEIPMIDRQNSRRPECAYGGRAELVVENRHFAEEFVFAQYVQLDLLVLGLYEDFDSTVLDDIHAIAQFPLTHNDLAVSIHPAQGSRAHGIHLVN